MVRTNQYTTAVVVKILNFGSIFEGVSTEYDVSLSPQRCLMMMDVMYTLDHHQTYLYIQNLAILLVETK